MAFCIQLESFKSYHNLLTLSALDTLVLQSCLRTLAQVVSHIWIILSSLLHLLNSTRPSHLRLFIHQEVFAGLSPDQTILLKALLS